jgi:hypothetical protein
VRKECHHAGVTARFAGPVEHGSQTRVLLLVWQGPCPLRPKAVPVRARDPGPNPFPRFGPRIARHRQRSGLNIQLDPKPNGTIGYIKPVRSRMEK